MRIVAGNLRGKTIQAPDGQGTRPTTDRVREALFSSLYSHLGGFEDVVALDAFAGSGALGLEALSRGARQCTFFENDAKALKVLRRNVASCGLEAGRARVVSRDVMNAAFEVGQQPFGLVFLDPPYACDPERVLGLVKRICDAGCLAENAIVSYEHADASRDEVAAAIEAAGFATISTKKYGKTSIALFAAGERGEEAGAGS